MSKKVAISVFALLLIGFLFGRYSVSLWQTKPVQPAIPDERPASAVPILIPSSPPTPMPEPTPTASSPPQSFLDVGQTGIDGGLIFSLESWSESLSIPKRRGGEIRAKEGAKFVVAKIKFQNNRMASVDIYCRFHLGSALFDKDNRKFDHIKSLYDIEGNTGCNDNIQPGFSSSETIAFELPEAFKPDYLMFWDPQDVIGENKDSFGERTSIRFRLK